MRVSRAGGRFLPDLPTGRSTKECLAGDDGSGNTDIPGQAFLFCDVPLGGSRPIVEVARHRSSSFSPHRLEQLKNSLLAKYLSIAHGMPMSHIGEILGVSSGQVSRLIHHRLEVKVNLMRSRTRADHVMDELGLKSRRPKR